MANLFEERIKDRNLLLPFYYFNVTTYLNKKSYREEIGVWLKSFPSPFPVIKDTMLGDCAGFVFKAFLHRLLQVPDKSF